MPRVVGMGGGGAKAQLRAGHRAPGLRAARMRDPSKTPLSLSTSPNLAPLAQAKEVSIRSELKPSTNSSTSTSILHSAATLATRRATCRPQQPPPRLRAEARGAAGPPGGGWVCRKTRLSQRPVRGVQLVAQLPLLGIRHLLSPHQARDQGHHRFGRERREGAGHHQLRGHLQRVGKIRQIRDYRLEIRCPLRARARQLVAGGDLRGDAALELHHVIVRQVPQPAQHPPPCLQLVAQDQRLRLLHPPPRSAQTLCRAAAAAGRGQADLDVRRPGQRVLSHHRAQRLQPPHLWGPGGLRVSRLIV